MDLSQEQQAFLEETLERIRGKSIPEAVAVISDAAKRMPKGREFTKEERMMMVEKVLETVPEGERGKYRKIASFFI